MTEPTIAPVQLVDQLPISVQTPEPEVVLIDFGRVAFGNLLLNPASGAKGDVIVHFGEALAEGRVDRDPPGSVRYATVRVKLEGDRPLVVAPPADTRNTNHPAAIHTPAEWGVILPFRWVEIEGWPGSPSPGSFRRRAAFAATWDDHAACFDSSNPSLNAIWELCRYSIKATTFAGVYVDGDRERTPYEADAYLNQLSHYACDPDPQMARATFDRLLEYPTWPTEWAFHLIFMAHADWWQTGDRTWLTARYEALKPKLLPDRLRADGLLESREEHIHRIDLVDWPPVERDGYVFTHLNTVVNAFHLRALTVMAELATALGDDQEAAYFRMREHSARTAFHRLLFDPACGLYRDGLDTKHTSLHANLFPLAFGLVPPEHRARITDWLVGRGMACSVYAAQYFLEALFENEAAAPAIALIDAPGDRSWKHMVNSGTTLTWEAWDQRYKPNQDWNHAWGAAPANLLPRYVLGIRAREPGWTSANIRPHIGNLRHAAGKTSTPHGAIEVSWQRDDAAFRLELNLPPGMTAHVQLPAPERSTVVAINGQLVSAHRTGSWWSLEAPLRGRASIEVKAES